MGTRAKNKLLRRDRPITDLDGMWVNELSGTEQDVDAFCFIRFGRMGRGVGLDNGANVRHHVGRIELHRALGFDPELPETPDLMGHIGRLDQRLAGNTSEPRAVATDLSLLGQGGFLDQTLGQLAGDQPSRAGPENNNVIIEHVPTPSISHRDADFTRSK